MFQYINKTYRRTGTLWDSRYKSSLWQSWTGEAVREDKRGAIPEGLPPILARLGISSDAWMRLATEFEASFRTWVGSPERVPQTCQQLGYERATGIGACRELFPSS